MPGDIKVGVLPWGQQTDWPSLLHVGARADELGYDSLWTWDHLYPIQGDWRGPIFEGYMTLAGWAGVTSKVTLGLMLPGLLAVTIYQFTSALEQLEIGGPDIEQVVTSKHQAMILEKLAHHGEAEEEIPAGV